MSDAHRIASILGEWRERLDRGEDVDPERVISQHPELAEDLRAQFKALSQMRHAEAAKKAPTTLRTLPIDRYGEFQTAGEGGMGIVYWAIDTDLNREVAFKIIRPGTAEGTTAAPDRPTALTPPGKDTPASKSFETLKQRFLQEAWITSGMAHPGIVPVYELGQTSEGVPYYTMRFIKGKRTLATAIEEIKAKDIEERLALLEPFLKVCDTMRYAHSRGVIHRDLKPENIAIGEFGEVVLLDWGLAKLKGSADLEGDRLQAHVQAYREATDLKTIAGAMGTPGYMGPEAALGKSEVMDERSDVYSLGVMLFEILTGRLPFEFTTFGELAMKLLKEDAPAASDVDPAVPEALSDLCALCLAREMDGRPESADAVATAIRAWQVEREREREIEGFLREAKTALASAEGLRGAHMLQEVDRATAAVSQVLKRRPESTRALQYQTRAEAMREKGIRERERGARKKVLLRGGIAVGTLLLLTAAAVGWVLNERRKEADEARRVAVQERDAKAKALTRADGIRLAAESAAVRQSDPSLALLLAIEGAEREPGLLANNALLGALDACHERAACIGHGHTVESAVFDAEGRRVLTSSRDGTARLWDGTTGKLLRTFKGHEGPVFRAIFDPSGKRVLTVSDDGTARLWDAESGEVLLSFTEHGDSVLWGAFDLEGRRVLTTSDEGKARMWDAETGEQLFVVEDPDRAVAYACFDPDGSRFATVSAGLSVPTEQGGIDRLPGRAIVWDAATGEKLLTLKDSGGAPFWLAHCGGVTAASFDPSGRRVAAVGPDYKARVYDATTGALVHLLETSAWSVLFSPDGKLLATTTDDGPVQLWDAATGELARLLEGHGEGTGGAQFTTDGSRLLTWSADSTIRLWDVATGKALRTFTGHGAAVYAGALAPDERRFVTASGDRTARVWDVECSMITVVGSATDPMEFVEFLQGGERVFTISKAGVGRLWDAVSGECVATLGGGKAKFVRVNFSKDRSRIAGGFSDGSIRSWDARAGKEILVRTDLHATSSAVLFSPDGSHLLTYDHSGHARLLDRETGEEVRNLDHLAEDLVRLRFDAGGARAITSHGGGAVVVWDVHTGKELHRFATQAWQYRWSASFNSDGTRAMAWGPWDDRVYLLDVETGRILLDRYDAQPARLSPRGDLLLAVGVRGNPSSLYDTRTGERTFNIRGHHDAIEDAAFHPDGHHLVTGSYDRTGRIWDVATGKTVHVLRGHRDHVTRISFDSTGQFVVSSSIDNTLRLWDAETGAPVWTVREPSKERSFAPEAVASRGGDWILTHPDGGRGRIWPTDPLAVAKARKPREFTDAERHRYDFFTPEERERYLERLSKEPRLESASYDTIVRHTGPNEEASQLNQIAWPVVARPGRSERDYRRALDAALRATELEPDDAAILNTLGVAQYRVGEYEKAIETLERSDVLNKRNEPADMAFLAMTLYRLDRKREARQHLERLRTFVEKLKPDGSAEPKAFLAEVEALFTESGSGDD